MSALRSVAQIASNMQKFLLSPLERMTKIIKILSGRRWRKFSKEIGGAEQRSPAEMLDELECAGVGAVGGGSGRAGASEIRVRAPARAR